MLIKIVYVPHKCIRYIADIWNLGQLSQRPFHASPWSRSDADTVNTVDPGGWFSAIWASYWLSSNHGTSSLTSITWTHSSWLDECWGIPWSSAIIVRLKISCSSRSRGLKIEREPAEKKNQTWNTSLDLLSVRYYISRGQLYTWKPWELEVKGNKQSRCLWLRVLAWLKKEVWKDVVWGLNQSLTPSHKALPTWVLPPLL